MPFTIDENSLLIKGRRGDTASFVFNFEQDISAYTLTFFIKKNISDKTAIVEKQFANPTTKSVVISLTSEDTSKLLAPANSYNTYYWGLKINIGTEFAQTLIPQEFDNPPVMQIYPTIGEI